jgi:glycosyltransferase involved in cell wall biosynthesis
MIDLRKLLIAVPALNEREALPNVLTMLKQSFPTATILVIDDGSSDSTPRIAIEQGVRVVIHPFNLGVGAAMRTAFKYAIQYDYSYVIQFDADGQHSEKYVLDLLAQLKNSDIVIGSRFLSGSGYQIEPSRRFAIRILSKLIKLGTGQVITDPTSGNRGTGKQAIEIFAMKYPTEYLGDTVGSLIIAAKHGLKLKEIPVEMHLRQGGNPSQSFISSAKLFIRIILISLAMLTNTRTI